jgi:3-hydroxymyristoyl/3-hydroxydecanoyl-(acyl carrier protein) dehydratase
LASIVHDLPADLPAARGHFPGNPIVPGAVLLSETLNAIEGALQVRLSPCRITFAKFVRPARPGERVMIEYSDPVSGVITFDCSVGGNTVLKGEVRCDATAMAG